MAAWHNQKLIVYHGTFSGALSSGPISLASCRPATDFGQGFYTTTHRHQAEQWANEKARGLKAGGVSKSAASIASNWTVMTWLGSTGSLS